MKSAALAASLVLAALPAHAQDARVWSLDVQKTEAHLRFAQPGADELPLSLSCTRKTGLILVAFDVDARMADRLRGEQWVDRLGNPAPWPVSVTLASATARTTIPGKAYPDEMNGGSSIKVEITDRAPVMAEFAKIGVLRLTALGGAVEGPPPPKGLAGRLLRACKG